MAGETSIKRPKKPFKGAVDGKPFTTENQPSPESKKQGWEELRKQRLLTKNLIKAVLDEYGIPTKEGEDFFMSLLVNAKEGNSKAIDVVINALEEQKTTQEVKHIFPSSIEL